MCTTFNSLLLLRHFAFVIIGIYEWLMRMKTTFFFFYKMKTTILISFIINLILCEMINYDTLDGLPLKYEKLTYNASTL